jgi:parvulin-like peptidyl-prolyl isomerase
MRPGELPEALDRAVLGIAEGEVTAPILVGERLFIVKLIQRAPSTLPTFEESAPELQNRVYSERMAAARRHWLNQLRRRIHVEVRT